MKPLKPLLRLLRRISPEWLFLALLAVLLIAVALLWSDRSWWAVLPLTVAVGMVLTVIFNDRPEAPQIWANKPSKPDQKTYSSIKTEGRMDRTIDPENLKQLRR